MMRRRNNNNNQSDFLPLSGVRRGTSDGSGRAIHMDAPIVRAAKTASPYTKYSYVSIASCLFFIWLGWTIIQNHDASIILTCTMEGCTMQITPPGKAKKERFFIDRKQIIDSKMVKVDIDGNVATKREPKQEFSFDNNDSKPDENGLYESYVIILHPEGKKPEPKKKIDFKNLSQTEIQIMQRYGSAALTDPDLMRRFMTADKQHDRQQEHKREDNAPPQEADTNAQEQPTTTFPSLDVLKNFVQPDPKDGTYTLPIRLYNIGYTQSKSFTQMNKIHDYIHNRRHKMKIREERGVSWIGILLIVLPSFALLLVTMIGQFSDPKPEWRRRGGPPTTNDRQMPNKRYS